MNKKELIDSIAQKTGFVKKRVEFTNLSCLIINNGKI